MSRRLEIELTSTRPDGSWTWRAAGAREPRGVIDEKLLGPTRHVGDTLRVEADFTLDGIVILSVLPEREQAKGPERIELLPSPRVEPVTSTLVPKPSRGRDRRGERTREGESRDERGRRGPRTGPSQRARPSSGARAPIGEGARDHDEAGRRQRDHSRGRARPQQQERRATVAGAPTRPERPRPFRLVPKSVHRDEYLATLSPERRPIAEQLIAGGLPAVRKAIAEEQAAAKAAARPPVNGDAILGLAEQMVDAVKQASWLDRAEATKAEIEKVSLRDLRAAIAGAAPRDDAGRRLLSELRDAFDTRLNKLRAGWEESIVNALDEGRILQALRLSARPPEPSTRFPASLVGRLAEQAGAALSKDISLDRWSALLEAGAASPVRRSIQPAGIPEDETGQLRQLAALQAGRIPALAKLLGLSMPPPPGPVGQGGARTTQRPRSGASARGRARRVTDSPAKAQRDEATSPSHDGGDEPAPTTDTAPARSVEVSVDEPSEVPAEIVEERERVGEEITGVLPPAETSDPSETGASAG